MVLKRILKGLCLAVVAAVGLSITGCSSSPQFVDATDSAFFRSPSSASYVVIKADGRLPDRIEIRRGQGLLLIRADQTVGSDVHALLHSPQGFLQALDKGAGPAVEANFHIVAYIRARDFGFSQLTVEHVVPGQSGRTTRHVIHVRVIP